MLQSLAGAAERILYGRRISRVEVAKAPLFVIGHWRSGTSLLHELLGLDSRHTYPTNYQCFNPGHFLLTERFLKPLLSRAMPERRPQDNMTITLDSPQEDECALSGIGAPSPYAFLAFPNDWQVPLSYYAVQELSDAERRRWERAFLYFLKKITLADPRRIIVKSPTHTFRAGELLQLFPRARFVHIVRDPYAVYASTMNLWRSVCTSYALEKPDFTGLEEFVLRLFLFAHEKSAEARTIIPAGQFYELRYEDLVSEPEKNMRALYDGLGMTDFGSALLPGLRQYLAERAFYKTNTYRLPPATTEKISTRWGDIIKRYGYDFR